MLTLIGILFFLTVWALAAGSVALFYYAIKEILKEAQYVSGNQI